MISFQIPQPVRSTSYSNEEGHCLRGIHRRRQRDCRQGRATQLQVGRREQDQSPYSLYHSVHDIDVSL